MLNKLKKLPAIKRSLILLAIGIIIFLLIFPYYYFHLGVKPCKGLPSDPSNCGDGDFGGLYFIYASAPFLVAGILSFSAALLGIYNNKYKSKITKKNGVTSKLKSKPENKWLKSTLIVLIVVLFGSGLIFGFIILYYGAIYADLAIKCYSYDKNPNVSTSELDKYYSAPEIMGNKPYEVTARHNGSCTDAVDRIEVTANYKIQSVRFDELSNEVKSKLNVIELDKNQQPALCTMNSGKDSSKKINFLQAGGNDIKPGSTEGIFYIIWYDIYPSSARLGNEDKIKADCKDYNKTGNEMIDGLTIKTSFTPKR